MIYEFIRKYNCEVAPKYSLHRKLLTMRDIGWICTFINDADLPTWEQRYYWSLRILAIEGINFVVDETLKLSSIRQ